MRMPRMSGAVTGNFGRAKVKARPGTLDISNETLNKNNLRIPKESEGIARYIQAYNTTNDPKLKKGLLEMIRNYQNKQMINQQYIYTIDIIYLYGAEEHFKSIKVLATNEDNALKIVTNNFTCKSYAIRNVEVAPDNLQLPDDVTN